MDTDSENAEFKAWAMQWKSAAVPLQEVHDAELRELESRHGSMVREDPYQNGLVMFRRWMMRKAILDAYGHDQHS